MTPYRNKPRVLFFANPDKADAQSILDDLVAFAQTRCEVVDVRLSHSCDDVVESKTDRIVVLGGDGTLIGLARSLGSHQKPIVGVNLGKLGFLAEFSVDELKQSFDRAMTDDTIIGRRTVLEVVVHRNGETPKTHLAINDCVVQAGPPFRIVRLGVSINGERLTEVAGDGLIISTPCGSTAHNLSAGGPIMQAGVEAIILTPVCPHSLTHKPLVVERESEIEILACEVNEGTTAIIDGQVPCPLQKGDRVQIRRFGCDFQLVHNPMFPPWHNLVSKLHWGQLPGRQ